MKRLAALLLVGGLVAASCSTDEAGSDAVGSAQTTRPDATTSTTEPRLPDPPRYRPAPGEPVPEVKQLAADVLQAIGTYDGGAGTPGGARQRLAGLVVDPAVADQAGALLVPDSSSSVEIVYPQLGGLTETEASVMVVVRHRTLAAGGDERVVTRTVDVRVTRGPAGWSVSQIASVGGEAVEPVPPSPAARAVLASDSIDLPDSARWDIEAGRVDDRVLQVLADLASRYTVSVAVLASGHPANVFATDVTSNHTSGRGVDIWAVDGQPVVSRRDQGGPVHRLVTELLGSGVTELGSPWDLDGPGSRVSFTNTVHQDHVHVAYDS